MALVETQTAETHQPARKRQKTQNAAASSSKPTNRLFAPFRALGLVSNHVPFALQTRTFKGATEVALEELGKKVDEAMETLECVPFFLFVSFLLFSSPAWRFFSIR